MSQYIATDENTDEVKFGDGRPDPIDLVGPPTSPPEPLPGIRWRLWQLPYSFGDAPSPRHRFMWTSAGPQWIVPGGIELQRAVKADEIGLACRAHIESGFECAALGAPYLYPAKAQDQANLVASITDSLLADDDSGWTTPFWCADEAGVWEFRPHTAAQIRQVGREGKSAIIAAMQKNEELQRQIAAASAEQLESIIW